MSGAQIGGVIGAVVGAYFGGNWQLGYAIGSAIGGFVDPDRIAGPRAGDIARQTAQEGVPCPLYAGTAGGAGNLIFKGPVDKVIVDEQQGKGGPVVETERLYCTFAIRIGASLFYGPGTRDGLIGLSRIWEDERLVFDVTPTSQIMAESAKYAEGFTFYVGNDTQLPDPSMEAILGAGNVPSYRGRAYVVFPRKDLTDRRGAVPQFRFEVSAQGVEAPPETVEMVEYEADGINGGAIAGYIAVYQRYLDVRAFTGFLAELEIGGGPVYVRVIAPEAAGGQVLWDSGWMGDLGDQLALDAALASATTLRVGDPVGSGFTDYTDPGVIGVFRTNLNGAIVPESSVSGYFVPPYGIGDDSIVQVIRSDLNPSAGAEWTAYEPDPDVVDEPYIAIPELPGAIVGLTTGTVWFTPYATGVGIITPGTTTFGTVVPAIGKICKVDASVFDIPDVLGDRLVRGLVLASQDYTGSDAINSMRWVYLCDVLDADGQLHFIPRGGAIKATIIQDDLVDDQDDGEQGEEIRSGEEQRTALAELPLKVNLFFPDPIIGYALSKATSPNFGDRPDSVTEINMEVPVVLDGATEAPQLADIIEKVSDADAQGEVVRVVPEQYAYLTGTDCIHLVERGITRRYRIDKDREGEGRKRLQMRYDRASNYVSKATQEATPTPPVPPSTLAGPTILKVMNDPALIDADDRIGVRVAFGAVLPGWSGATLQYSADDGATWVTVGNYTTRAMMGTLADELPYASALVTDWVNPLNVTLFDDRDLESATELQLQQEANGAAIIKPDSTVEIVQYLTATDAGGNLWSLWGKLLRGRLETVPATHGVGAYFVTLASTVFVELPSALIGRALIFRAVSAGAAPETAEQVSFTFDPVVSQTEWMVSELEADRDAGTLAIEWMPRHRFGTELAPFASVNFDGFRVTVTDGAVETITDTTADNLSMSDAAFTGAVDITVEPINRITGANSPAELIGVA